MGAAGRIRDSLTGRARRSDSVDRAARAGLLAYGLVHLVVGWLALQLAVGDSEGAASGSGAIRELAQQPFGEVLVWLVAVGMALLVLWQLLEAAVGHRQEKDAKRTARRLASAGKAVVYGYISYSAVRIAIGAGSSGGGSDSMTARLMDLPAGQLLVGLVGAVIIGIGFALAWKGFTHRFTDDLTREGRRGSSGTAYVWLGKVGHVAKGVAFGLVGSLFGYAAVTHEAQKSGGLDQALQEVLDQPFGPFLLTVIALGIACFGLFCFAHARHLSR